jgi:prepilin signal peptidase PulO-like enzyme (type II secretory pathway)
MDTTVILAVVYLLLSAYLSYHDIREGQVSRWVLWLGILVTLGLRTLIQGIVVLPEALGGTALGLVLFLLVYWSTGKKLGLADVWYAGLIGAALGPWWWFVGIGTACILGIGYCAVRGRRMVPFVPFMAAGSLAVIPFAWFRL